jgi:hypothetical protein
MTKPFHEATLKIQRAKQHINDLNRIFAAFVGGKTHLVFIEHDAESGDDLLKVKGTKRLEDDFVLTLGDAVHNLRTALDYVMNDIEFATTGQRTAYTKFPVYPTRDALEAAANGAMKQKVPKEVIDCIVHTIQPYKGGNGNPLWCLHELDIEDKHRLQIANTEIKFIHGICIEDKAGEEVTVGTWLVVPGKIAFERLPAASQFKLKDQGQASYRVTFGQGLPFAELDVIPTLYDLIKFIEGALTEIQYWFGMSQIKW